MKKNKLILTQGDLTEMVKSVLSILCEDVYINNLNDKGKIANITYQKGEAERGKKKVYSDFLGTDKMEKIGNDTYIVNLKGNIPSYNITSINGTEVMHYFKNYFERKQTNISVKDKNGNKENYKLKMEEKEFNVFKKTFFQKVNAVIQDYIDKHKEVKFEKVSIYPVPSSSNFNVSMAREMSNLCFSDIKGGTQVINTELFKKDLKNIEVDADFIEKNKDYYNTPLYKDNINGETHLNSVNTTVNKFKKYSEYIDSSVVYINRLIKRIMSMVDADRAFTKRKNNGNEFSPTLGKRLFNLYYQLANIYEEILENSEYIDDFTKKTKRQYVDDQVKPLKYAKTPSNIKNTELVYSLVKPYIRGVKTRGGKPISKINIMPVENRFAIKSLTNDIRMGIRNYFSKNDEIVKTELEKIKNTLFVIFDDNISGGATLSDICYQAKKLGIEYIVPITFGQMSLSYAKFGGSVITQPDKGFNY